MESAKPVVIGIDIGGTTTCIAFVDKTGATIIQETIPTEAGKPFEGFQARVIKCINGLQSQCGDTITIRGIGIGAPSANYYSGAIEKAPNLGWGDFIPLREIFHQKFLLPVAVTNDANAAAVGEMLYGSARGKRHIVIVTLGTGLGSGFIVDGAVLYGSDGFAGELGHIIAVPDGRLCGCGRLGCLETYVSATGIRRTVVELLAKRTAPSRFRSIAMDGITAKDITVAAQEGDPIALESFEFTGTMLGLHLSNMVALFSPECIVLFGGLALAGDLLLHPTKKSLQKNTLHIFQGKTELFLSSLQEDNAGVLGAAALIWNEPDVQG